MTVNGIKVLPFCDQAQLFTTKREAQNAWSTLIDHFRADGLTLSVQPCGNPRWWVLRVQWEHSPGRLGIDEVKEVGYVARDFTNSVR